MKPKITYSELTSHWSRKYTNCIIPVMQMRNLSNKKLQHLGVPPTTPKKRPWDIGTYLLKTRQN